MPNELRLSYSAISDWRACPQKWWHTYVEFLKPKVEDSAPNLGTVLHDYLETYYNGLKDRVKIADAHAAGLETVEGHRERLQQLAWTASAIGEDEIGRQLVEVVDVALRIVTGYYRVRGKADKKHKILLVEHKIEFPLWEDGPIVPMKIDLVTERDGDVFIWEHKSTKNIPRAGRRLRDLQTTLYAAVLAETTGLEPRQVIWNYLNTKPPVIPELMKGRKDPVLSTRTSMHTTVDIYLEAIAKNGLQVKDYRNMISQLEESELSSFFPRWQLPLMQDEGILLRDFVTTAREIVAFMEQDDPIPVRNIGAPCDWCAYAKLTEAAILGGDVAGEKIKRFSIKEPVGKEQANDNDNGLADILA